MHMRASIQSGTLPNVRVELLDAGGGLRMRLCGRCAFRRSAYTSIASNGGRTIEIRRWGFGRKWFVVQVFFFCGESDGNTLRAML